MTPQEYECHDALGLAALVRAGEVSADELLAAAAARIGAGNGALNAVIVDGFGFARAELAARRAAGRERDGVFAGVPVLVKDLLATVTGLTTWHGNRLLKTLPPADHDSSFARRLRATGALIVGKTNTPEFGLTPFTEPEICGPTRNPWDLSRTPGGSSGGSAAAVAAGFVPLATGGDGGGSIRIPASCCGLFGLKPTRGRVAAGPTWARCGAASRSSTGSRAACATVPRCWTPWPATTPGRLSRHRPRRAPSSTRWRPSLGACASASTPRPGSEARWTPTAARRWNAAWHCCVRWGMRWSR